MHAERAQARDRHDGAVLGGQRLVSLQRVEEGLGYPRLEVGVYRAVPALPIPPRKMEQPWRQGCRKLASYMSKASFYEPKDTPECRVRMRRKFLEVMRAKKLPMYFFKVSEES